MTATLTLGTGMLARTARRAPENGTIAIFLKPDQATAPRLHAGAQLRITITAAPARVTRTIRLQTDPRS